MAKQAQVAVGSEGTKKPVLIGMGVVAILLVIVGGFFLLAKPGQTAGQAIEVETVEGAGGQMLSYYTAKNYYGGVTRVLADSLKAGDSLSVIVWGYVPSGMSSVESYVKVGYDTSKVEVTQGGKTLLDQEDNVWTNDFVTYAKGGSGPKLWNSVHHSTLDFTKALAGGKAYQLAQFEFTVKTGVTLTPQEAAQAVTIEAVELYDLDTSKIISSGKQILQLSGETSCASCTLATIGDIDVGILGADVLGGKVSVDQMKTMCGQDKFKGVCTQKADGTYDVDLDGDAKVTDIDGFIIVAIKVAQNVNGCGGTGESPCDFDPYFTCDDRSFRIDGKSVWNNKKAFSKADGLKCNFDMSKK